MHATLTSTQTKFLDKVLLPSWPKLAFWRIAALTICGLGLLSFSIRDLVRLQNEGAGMTPSGITNTLARGLLLLAFSGMSLISALWACMTRYYGLLLRRLVSKNET
jgi:hypothetical protein